VAAGKPLVGIYGARSLRKDLRRLAEDQRSPLYDGMKEAARRALVPVAEEVRGRLPTSNRRANAHHVPGQLKGSVRLQVIRTGGGVRLGPPSRKFAGWVEFGGTRHKPHESSREFIKSGRYLFPAARSLSARAAQTYTEELQKVFDKFSWTNSNEEGT
jgi:hypothetical protein